MKLKQAEWATQPAAPRANKVNCDAEKRKSSEASCPRPCAHSQAVRYGRRRALVVHAGPWRQADDADAAAQLSKTRQLTERCLENQISMFGSVKSLMQASSLMRFIHNHNYSYDHLVPVGCKIRSPRR